MNNASAAPSLAQQHFDQQYISALEIERRLKIARCMVSLGLKRKYLPAPIVVGASTYVWLREEAEPFIARWAERIEKRKLTGATA